MATKYYNFGPTVIQTATGVAGAYEVLGVATKGGRIQIKNEFKDLRSDLSGNAAAERQWLGSAARISVELATVDVAVLTKVIQRAMANDAAAEGLPGTPGALMATGQHAHGLYLPSSNENPWVFTTAMLEEPEKVEGTEHEPFRLVFGAIRYIPGTASVLSNSYTLYTRVAPS